MNYNNTGAVPTFSMPGLPGANGLQDPSNYGWYTSSALRLQQERRYQFTKGAHVDASYGGDEFKVTAGAAWDEQYRLIRGYDNGTAFGEVGCNLNPTVALPAPNSTFGCAVTPGTIPASWTTYWNVADVNGSNYPKSLGLALPVTGTPLLPNSAIAQYLSPGPNGFALVNYAGIKAATNYNFFATTPALGAAANLQDPGRTGFSTGTNTGINSGIEDEKTEGFYAEISGTLHRGEQKLKYVIGGRWIRTEQILTGYANTSDPRNIWKINCGVAPYVALTPSGCAVGSTALVAAPDGTRYPNIITPTTATGSYSAFLPSANLVWEVMDDFQVRAAVSRTMTRANPASMLPQLGATGSGGDTYTLGNPNLRPFYSTNIDFGAELYTGGEGYIGVGLFKKMITGFQNNYTFSEPFTWLAQYGYLLSSYSVNSTQWNNLVNAATTAGCYNAALGAANTLSCVNVNVTQSHNAQGLESIKGLELNWVQPLDFMLDQYGLKGFGWQANATMISTKTTQGSAAPSVVLNVSPLTYNLTGYYDNDGIMVKASYAYQRGTITNSNVYGIISNIPAWTVERSMDYGTVDVSSSVKLSKFVGDLPSDPEVTFDVQNLTHAKVGRSYKQFTNVMNYSYNPGSLFMIGLRGSF